MRASLCCTIPKSSVSSSVRHARFFSSKDFQIQLRDEKNVSSPSGYIKQGDSTFEESLLVQARRSKFVPPSGYDMTHCVRRMKEIVRQNMVSKDTPRLGNVILLSNAVIRAEPDSKDWIAEFDAYVRSNVSPRSRFSNVFSLVQYLTYLSLAGRLPDKMEIMINTLERVNDVRVSDCIEIARLLLESKAILLSDQEDEIIALLRRLRNLLETNRDEHARSEKNRVNALRLAEYYFGDFVSTHRCAPSVSCEVQRLIYTVMRERKCGSSLCLEHMIRLGLSYKEESNKVAAREVACAIRETQLPRLHPITIWLNKNSDLRVSLRILSRYTGVDFEKKAASEDSETLIFGLAGREFVQRNLFDGSYTRETADFNEHALYRNGDYWLYFSTSYKCWQIGTDPSRPFLRLAYLPTDSSCPDPTCISGWKVLSRRTGSFITSSNTFFTNSRDTPLEKPRKWGKSRSQTFALSSEKPFESPAPEPAPPSEEIDVLEKWKLVSSVAAKTSNNEKLRELESLVASLHEKVEALNMQSKSPPCTTHTDNKSSRLSIDWLRGLCRFVSGAIDSIASGRDSMLQVPSISVRSFDSLRSDQIKVERLALQRKKIARAFR